MVLAGRVTDEAGQGLDGATVTARDTSAAGAPHGVTAGADGRYRLVLPAGADYAVEARMIGHRPQVRALRLDPGETQADFALVRQAVGLDQVVVTATRSASALSEVPAAVTVVTREQVVEQARVTPRLGAMLAQLVPGLGAGTETVSNYGQNLRGRTVLVMIDGVPQSTSRNVTRDFVNIDPAMVERVEVVRGASAMYGDGATGGVVNIITRRGDGATRFTTELGLETSLHAGAAAAGPRLAQTASGARGGVDWLGGITLARTGAVFDAEGDRVPPDPTGQGGVAETNSYDVLGKVGVTLGAQRLQATVNRFESEQTTDYATDPTVAQQPAGTQKSRAREGLQLERGQGTKNMVVNLEYERAALLGSRVRAQAYYRDYETAFGPGDNRGTPAFGNLIFQSYVDSRKHGGRLDVETPLRRRGGASILWGADYTGETTSQPIYTFDPAAYDASGGLAFVRNGERLFVPPINSRNIGLFAQAKAEPVRFVVLRAGIRHERATMDVDGFTALNGVAVESGRMMFTPTLFNAGIVVNPTAAIGVFANYSQGFSLADLGRVIRQPPAGFTLGDKSAEAQRVHQLEAGVRGGWPTVQVSLVGYRNTSKLGTSLGPDLEVVRAPERVYGAELSLDAQPLRRLSLGGTASWTEGEFRGLAGADSAWLPLNSFRIQPLKITGYVEHRTLPGWRTRLQVLHSGTRDRAYEALLARPGADPARPGFGERPVRSYTTVDLLSQVSVGPGTLSLGVRNLLDAQYFPVVSQLMPIGAVSYTAAPGATVSVGYAVSY
ncbi:MAG: TonB-dependent receptor [Gemmatimonadota bacterium]